MGHCSSKIAALENAEAEIVNLNPSLDANSEWKNVDFSNVDAVKLALLEGAKIKKGFERDRENTLHAALKEGASTETIELLLSKGAKIINVMPFDVHPNQDAFYHERRREIYRRNLPLPKTIKKYEGTARRDHTVDILYPHRDSPFPNPARCQNTLDLAVIHGHSQETVDILLLHGATPSRLDSLFLVNGNVERELEKGLKKRIIHLRKHQPIEHAKAISDCSTMLNLVIDHGKHDETVTSLNSLPQDILNKIATFTQVDTISPRRLREEEKLAAAEFGANRVVKGESGTIVKEATVQQLLQTVGLEIGRYGVSSRR